LWQLIADFLGRFEFTFEGAGSSCTCQAINHKQQAEHVALFADAATEAMMFGGEQQKK
jgi:hypothetical protein